MRTHSRVLTIVLVCCQISLAADQPSPFSKLFGDPEKPTTQTSDDAGKTAFRRLFGNPNSGPAQAIKIETPADSPTLKIDTQNKIETAPIQAQPVLPVQAIQPIPIPLEANMGLVIRDLASIDPGTRLYVRYLDLTAVYPTERAALYSVTSMVLNSLSWSNTIYRPSIVAGSDARLVRFDIRWFCRDEADVIRWTAAWEKMTKADPYYRIPWVNPHEAELARQFTYSDGCLLRADWFDFYAMKQDDATTKDVVEGFYSDFLGLPNTEAGLRDLLKVRLAESAQLGTDRRGVVVKSGTESDAPTVAFNNRKVNRVPTILSAYGGYFYYTQDFFNSRKDKNALNDPLNDDKDGGEDIFSLPNHLQGYYLVAKDKDKKDTFNQVSEVPIQIASSQFSHRRVKYDTCTHCHMHGINAYEDVLTNILLKAGPDGRVLLTETKPDVILRVKQLFTNDIKGIVNADQLSYSLAVELAGGRDPATLSEMWKKVMETYEATLTPERVAWEYGTTDVKRYLADKRVSSTEGALLAVAKAGPNERIIHRDTFEDEFQNGKLLQDFKVGVVNNPGTAGHAVMSNSWRLRNYPSARPASTTGVWPAKEAAPLSSAQVIEFIKQGKIDAVTEVCSADGSIKWTPAAKLFAGYF